MRIAIVNDMFMAVEAMRRVLTGAGGCRSLDRARWRQAVGAARATGPI
jgi:hypothetical protein